MSIHVLSDVVTAQIAAGEVVERPASVVKELVENALDAGASAITVEIEDSGKGLIRVGDDGHGISVSEAALAFERHSTSKLFTIEDLDHITTLGFRGEALASIAAVSRATVTTRHRDETAGITVRVEGGELRYERPVGAPVGTIVAVENLFFNTPARLKFLKSDSTERKHINTLVTHYAMAYPDVRFRLIQEGREQFHSSGSGDLADVLVEVFGLDAFDNMLEVYSQPSPRPDVPPVEVYGFCSTPDLSRANRSHIVLFVNGRVIANQSLTYAVVQAYQTLLPTGCFPLAVLMITLAPEDIDVNVHPTKAEVRFRLPDVVFAAVQRAVRHTVIDQSPAVPDPYREVNDGWSGRSTRPTVPGEDQLHMELGEIDPGRYSSPITHIPDSTAIPAGPERPLRPRTLPILRVIGQVGAMYIVTEGPAGLYLIDQHAAHARVLYDQMRRQRTAHQPPDRYELDGTPVELPPHAARQIEALLEALSLLGFEIEPFGGNTFRVRAIPAPVSEQAPGDVLYALAQEASTDRVTDELELEEHLMFCLSALGAYKAGEILDHDQMQALIRKLERCENPHTSPDGHPTLIHISGEDLARQFGRR
ncbi:MAG: DNA mismatch repair endonuclease MutL [Anaerolineae bacterium]|nr:DNA mismatch repair endonuclease MutL [Anaerolineae bacterium]